jgi:hypothetical protein
MDLAYNIRQVTMGVGLVQMHVVIENMLMKL